MQFEGQSQVFLAGHGGKDIQDGLFDVFELKRGFVQNYGTGFDFAQVKDIAQQAVKPAGAPAGHGDIFLLFRVQGGGLQQLEHAHDAVYGGTDFVAHVGQKFAFGPTAGVGHLLGPQQFLFVAVLLGDVAIGAAPPQFFAARTEEAAADMADVDDAPVAVDDAQRHFLVRRQAVGRL